MPALSYSSIVIQIWIQISNVQLLGSAVIHKRLSRVYQCICRLCFVFVLYELGLSKMKFAEHLSAHITPEWRKQYINYEVLFYFRRSFKYFCEKCVVKVIVPFCIRCLQIVENRTFRKMSINLKVAFINRFRNLLFSRLIIKHATSILFQKWRED